MFLFVFFSLLVMPFFFSLFGVLGGEVGFFGGFVFGWFFFLSPMKANSWQQQLDRWVKLDLPVHQTKAIQKYSNSATFSTKIGSYIFITQQSC